MKKLTNLKQYKLKQNKEDFIMLPIDKAGLQRHKLYFRLMKWTQRGRTVFLGIKESRNKDLK